MIVDFWTKIDLLGTERQTMMVTQHTTYTRNIMSQKCEGNCGFVGS